KNRPRTKTGLPPPTPSLINAAVLVDDLSRIRERCPEEVFNVRRDMSHRSPAAPGQIGCGDFTPTYFAPTLGAISPQAFSCSPLAVAGAAGIDGALDRGGCSGSAGSLACIPFALACFDQEILDHQSERVFADDRVVRYDDGHVPKVRFWGDNVHVIN